MTEDLETAYEDLLEAISNLRETQLEMVLNPTQLGRRSHVFKAEYEVDLAVARVKLARQDGPIAFRDTTEVYEHDI